MADKCKCVGVTMGGYENQVVVTAPPHVVEYRRKCNPNLGDQVCLDRCIALEVLDLWAQGITTNGCCCGHNLGRLAPYIGVERQDIPKMEALGYEHIMDCPFPDYHFHSKSVTTAPPAPPTPRTASR